MRVRWGHLTRDKRLFITHRGIRGKYWGFWLFCGFGENSLIDWLRFFGSQARGLFLVVLYVFYLVRDSWRSWELLEKFNINGLMVDQIFLEKHFWVSVTGQ